MKKKKTKKPAPRTITSMTTSKIKAMIQDVNQNCKDKSNIPEYLKQNYPEAQAKLFMTILLEIKDKKLPLKLIRQAVLREDDTITYTVNN